jgi:type 1 glutamine amidotransferase
MRFRLPALALAVALTAAGADRKISAVIIDGVNNHDWAAGTRAIQSILEGTGRFTVEVSTFPKLPEFSHYDVVINNFNGGHLTTGTRWPAAAEQALEAYVRSGGGLVVFHAANNAFLNWPAYNEMIGLGWRDKTFGKGLAVGREGQVVTIPVGEGLPPGHGPRHDFEVFTLTRDHPITRGIPAHWMHRSEQLTHGQHGPAEGLTILSYAFSEVSRQGEPMDWVRQYGKGRVYTTMLGHTWKDEPNPNLDDVPFQTLLARGAEWAATGAVTLPADLGWKLVSVEGWDQAPGGIVVGRRTGNLGGGPGEFELHLEYFVTGGGAALTVGGRVHTLSHSAEWTPLDVPAKPGPVALELRGADAVALFRNLRIRSQAK